MDDDTGAVLDDLAAESRFAERLDALAEYAALRNRWLRGEPAPGDLQRRRVLAGFLNRTGGIPPELHWPKRR